MRAGTCVVTITPPLGISMSGDFTGRLARSIASDLTARVLVLENGQTRLALVVIDAIIVTAEVTAAARALIGERTGISPDNIMISATHTHTGPAFWDVGNERPDPAYLQWLPPKIADAVVVAAQRLVPAQVAAGVASTRGVCHNRRIRMHDGRVTMNFMLKAAGLPPDSPEIDGPAGPIDPEVTALLVEDLNFTPIALWATIPSHHGETDDDHAYSPDYFGQFARIVSRALGDQCTAFLTTGASGNINTIDIQNTIALPYGDKRGRLVATAIAGAALQATSMSRRDQEPRLDARRWSIPVRRRAVPATDIELARRILVAETSGATLPAAQFSFATGDPIPDGWVALFAREVLAVAEMPGEQNSELQIMRIGDLAIAGLPGEFFVEYGLELKARSAFPLIAPVSMTNDHIGYVPTPKAMTEGGYETWTARSSWPVAETGAVVVESILERLEAMAMSGPSPHQPPRDVA